MLLCCLHDDWICYLYQKQLKWSSSSIYLYGTNDQFGPDLDQNYASLYLRIDTKVVFLFLPLMLFYLACFSTFRKVLCTFFIERRNLVDFNWFNFHFDFKFFCLMVLVKGGLFLQTLSLLCFILKFVLSELKFWFLLVLATVSKKLFQSINIYDCLFDPAIFTQNFSFLAICFNIVLENWGLTVFLRHFIHFTVSFWPF